MTNQKYRTKTAGAQNETTTKTPMGYSGKQSTEEESSDDVHAGTCPECGGRITEDAKRGETACNDCGLVVTEDEIDHGPEWRAFDAAEKQNKKRTGSPQTNMMHDKGLSTVIGRGNKDAYGRSISAKKRRQMSRLRKWDERKRTKDSKERNLKQALGEIDRMASAMGIPDDVREVAAQIYRKALDEDLIRGRSIEGMASGALHAAYRQAGVPRTMDDLSAVSRVPKKEISRAFRYISEELGLEVAPPTPDSHLPSIASAANVNKKLQRFADEMIELLLEGGLQSGKHPAGIAAAAVYAADRIAKEQAPELTEGLTQKQMADVAGVCEVTIRNRSSELESIAEEHGLTVEGGEVDTSSVARQTPAEPETEPVTEDSESSTSEQDDSTSDVETDAPRFEDVSLDDAPSTESEDAGDSEEESEEATDTADNTEDTTGVVADEDDDAVDESSHDDNGIVSCDGDDMTAVLREDVTQADVMVEVVNTLIRDYGLLDEVDTPYSAPRCRNPVLIAPSEKGECEFNATWHETAADTLLNTKHSSENKKTRIQQICAEVDVDLTFENW